ncbi:structural maintenance of chromosomes protein [Encephalitozoon hellem ATCC 50504]|uniref:Structural maintenance of chromosomes protein 3 n=1 Tax=Encephalitozoon hellem TaxID=27973 RepID=A0A9Q9C1Q4_ENCHE|nr:structural maintenance of chromosomes protein [Encephalitozoon hellem ATCC 50504]AFM99088.1 structural maintenance of chromosomes protein [Encephalitozoon hellem ATCC 50504]UTX42494.1 structural maintenance of chromosomes protein 3 [Encephalitozoon hellem]|eukprot:XP_003888069.1 structural maintenance of chromosomes protein [Encephalitozoon hellem ATCC 50504]
MHIKQIRLKNFKSFKDETLIPLSEGVNIVVGRNGSGKSSIVSAIRFVLCGEKYSCESRMELIHEGIRASEEEASVEIVFHDETREFEEKGLSVRRVVGIKRDEYMLDGKVMSKEEIAGLLQSRGFTTDSPYFIVLQEEVSEFAILSDKKRYELMKDVAGVSGYERDRENSMSMLEETRIGENKIELLLDKIEEKLRGFENDKREAELCLELKKEKRRLEYGYIEREVGEINKEISSIESLVSNDLEESSEEHEDYGCEIREIENRLVGLISRRKELYADEKYKEKECEIEEEMRKIEKKRSDFCEIEKTEKRNLMNLRRDEKENFVKSGYIKYLVGFLETLGNREVRPEEIEAAREALKQKIERLKAFDGPESSKAVKAEERKNLEELIEKRKYLWREERRLKLSEESIAEVIKSQEDRLIVMGNGGVDAYRQIKCEKGVLGYVYDLISVPNELASAFEAVVGNALFNIVVENEEVASNVLRKMKDLRSRITFMPLNRIKYKEEDEVKDPNVISLTSQLKCNHKYKALLGYITRSFYLCPDLKQALYSSKKYGINVVTLSGEIVTREGPITGGYERRNMAFQEYKKICKEARRMKGEIARIQHDLRKISGEIEEARMYREESGDGSRYHESLKSGVLFLQEKIEILEKIIKDGLDRDKISGRLRRLREEEKDSLLKSIWIAGEIKKVDMRIKEARIEIKRVNDSMGHLKEELEKSKMYKEAIEIDKKILELKDRRRVAKEMMFNEDNMGLFARPKKINIEMEKLMRRKHMLINKRNELCEKIGVSDFKNLERLFPDKGKEEIMEEIARINERIRGLSLVNRTAVSQWESYIGQKDSMRKKLEDMKYDKKCILDFMAELDSRKEDTMKKAIEIVKEGFSEFYSRLTNGGTAELYSYESGIGVRVGEGTSTNLLSGGQKALVALCLIFSMQKVSPSPLYVLDEIDANLDSQSRERVSALIREMSMTCKNQFIVTTFRKELLNCGDKYLNVEFQEKRSNVREIDVVAAHKFLEEGLGER